MTSRRARLAVVAPAVAALLALSGCSVVDNVVGGAREGIQNEAERIIGDGLSDVLGGAGITTDGELPPGFPEADVPLVGEVRGGASAPEEGGWVVQTDVAGVDDFTAAVEALAAAGFTETFADSDATSGAASLTSDTHRVQVALASEPENPVLTYIVTRV